MSRKSKRRRKAINNAPAENKQDSPTGRDWLYSEKSEAAAVACALRAGNTPKYEGWSKSFLEARDFSVERLGIIWRAIEQVEGTSGMFAVQDVIDALRSSEQLDDCGGEAYLSDLLMVWGQVSEEDVMQSALNVYQLGVRRRILLACSEMADIACNQALELDDVIERVENGIRVVFAHMFNSTNGQTEIERLKSMSYGAYLQTHHWQQMRSLKLWDAEFRCQLCGAHGEDTQLHVHHNTYERRGEERMADLTVLCADCHSRHHGVGKHMSSKNGAKKSWAA